MVVDLFPLLLYGVLPPLLYVCHLVNDGSLATQVSPLSHCGRSLGFGCQVVLLVNLLLVLGPRPLGDQGVQTQQETHVDKE